MGIVQTGRDALRGRQSIGEVCGVVGERDWQGPPVLRGNDNGSLTFPSFGSSAQKSPIIWAVLVSMNSLFLSMNVFLFAISFYLLLLDKPVYICLYTCSIVCVLICAFIHFMHTRALQTIILQVRKHPVFTGCAREVFLEIDNGDRQPHRRPDIRCTQAGELRSSVIRRRED
jgi:hypothetical protein